MNFLNFLIKSLLILTIMLIPLAIYASAEQDRIEIENIEKILDMAGDLKPYGNDAADIKLDFDGIINYIKNLFFKEIGNIVTKMPVLITLLIVFSLKNCFDFGDGIKRTVDLGFFSVAALICAGIISDFFNIASDMVSELSKFIYLTIPFMTGLIASGGMVVSSAKGAFIILTGMNIITYAINHFFMPLVKIIFIFGVVSALLNNGMLNSAKKTAKSIVMTMLPIMIALFGGILSLFMAVSKKTDDFTIKSAKLAISNMVPFLGSTLADSSEYVLNSLGAIRAQTGIASVLAMIYIFLLPIIKVVCGLLAFKFLSVIAGLLSDKQMTSFYDDMSAAMAMLSGIMAAMAVITVIGVVVLVNF